MGVRYLNAAAEGEHISRYHLEAAIAYEHCIARTYPETDWQRMLKHYDLLAQLVPSPVILLNRAVVVRELYGAQAALDAIHGIAGIDLLNRYYLLHALLGELYAELNKVQAAERHYRLALD